MIRNIYWHPNVILKNCCHIFFSKFLATSAAFFSLFLFFLQCIVMRKCVTATISGFVYFCDFGALYS